MQSATKVEKNFALTKESGEKELKMYFNAILRLAKSSEEYPVNLDEVWMLVYSERGKAVRALKENFIENVDFISLAQNGRQNNLQGSGGANKVDYYLTLSCMEFFIARKVRAVFDVYRKVFHKVSESVKEITLTDKMKAATWASKFLNLNEPSKLLMAKKILDPMGLPTPDYTPSKGILKSASELLKEHNLTMSAQKFNQRLIEKGYLVELSRSSSHGGVKRFKSITENGLKYGENQVNPQNPKQTQPLFYVDKFGELLKEIGENANELNLN